MTLDEIRAEIDAVDAQMKSLFLKRMECSRHVAEVKAITGSDVFAPERERSIIEKRTRDVEEACEEYVAFLRHLMSLSRRFQYGILTDMQDQVLSSCLEKAGLDESQEHRQVEISFSCKKDSSDLNLYLDMVKLNEILIDEAGLHTENGHQTIRMILDGNLAEKPLRRLLCQLGKETENFAILALR